MKNCDLTTSEGKQDALVAIGLELPKPLIYYVLKSIFGSTNSNSIESQADQAEKLIEAGKKQGVDEMTITMDDLKGLKINTPEDVSLNVEMGSHRKMTLHVKYK